VANLHAQPRELLARSGFLATIGSQMSFTRLEDAARAFERASADGSLAAETTFQSTAT
jgi:hypothetical protein